MFSVSDFEVAAFGPANLFDITDKVKGAVSRIAVSQGFVLLLSVGSTGALVTLSEDAQEDFVEWVRRNLPFELFHRHPGNAFAHLRSTLIGCQLLLPIKDGELILGKERIVLLENTAGRKRRRISVRVVGGD